MNFEPSDERRMLTDSLTRFLAEQYPHPVRAQAAYSPAGYSPRHWQQLADLGALAALFAPQDEGLGGSGFDVAAVFECLGQALAPEPVLGNLLVGSAIAHAGSDAQRALLPRLMDGSTIAALAHDEPGQHHSLHCTRTQAVPTAQGWALHGRKTAVIHGQHAHWLLISAGTPDGAAGQGSSLFLLPANTPGLRLQSQPRIDGGSVADVWLDGVSAGVQHLLGAAGAGQPVLEHALGHGLLALGAEAVGAMSAALAQTREYLQTRQQFGRPIGSFQALQHRMADLLLELEQARSAVINAAAALHAPQPERARALSAAKYSVGHIGQKLAQECIQLHGGIGMTWELPLSHYAKRLVMIDHQLGDRDAHLQRYMALAPAAAG